MNRPMAIIVPQITARNYLSNYVDQIGFPPYVIPSGMNGNYVPLYKNSVSLPINTNNIISIHKLPILCQDALKKILNGEFDMAEQLCYQSLQHDGESADAYILLSACFFATRRFDRVIRYCHRAIALDNQRFEPYVFLGNTSYDSSRIAEAIDYFKFASVLKPDCIESLLGIVRCYSASNNYELAIQYLINAIHRYPDLTVLHFELGILFKNLGRFYEAKKSFEKALELKPDYSLALVNLGYIFSFTSQPWLALHYFEKSILVDPLFYEGYIIYANTLKEYKLHDKAIQVYIKAMSIFPNSPHIYNGLANVYHDYRMYDLAIETYMVAVSHDPNFPDAYCNLANTYKDKGHPQQAEHFYNIAINLNPNHCDSYNNLANIYREQGKLNEALKFYSKALEIAPEFAAAHSNIATVYQQFGNYPQSVFHFQRAISINPHQPETYSLFGNLYKEMGNYKNALECYSKTIQLNPISADSHAQVGSIYKDVGHVLEAINSFKLALKFKPDYYDVYSNLVHCYLMICEWSEYSQRVQKLVAIVTEQLKYNRPPSVHPHHAMLYPLTPLERMAIARSHANFCYERVRFLGFSRTFEYNSLSNAKIKIGYVSSDFCNHPTSHLIQSVPGSHNRSLFEVFCFSLSPNDDSSFCKKIKTEVDHFIDVSGMPNVQEIANIINRMGINILLNLNGYTKGAKNEIFAMKPAPVQAMYLGYPGTSGAKYMDYIITDQRVSPLSQADSYAEKFAYMPDSFFIGDHANMFPHVLTPLTSNALCIQFHEELQLKATSSNSSELKSISNQKTLQNYIQFHLKKRYAECYDCKDCGERIPPQPNWNMHKSYLSITDDSFVFCNFNQLYKMDPNTFACWCRILNRTKNTVLWLLRFPRAGEMNLRECARYHKVSQKRLVFTDVASKEEHVRRGQLADVCLDTSFCNGHTTGMDVVWAGCPIVTMPGDCFAARVGSSIMYAIGCEELVVSNLSEYEEVAVRLANDHDYYKKVKKKIWLNRMTSSLFNVKEYVKNFDSLLLEMWKNYQNKNINHISLTPLDS